MDKNPLGLNGIAFIEFTSPQDPNFEKLWREFGFTKRAHHPTQNIVLFQQGEIRLHLNHQSRSFAETFYQQHGPSVSAMGWKFADASRAFQLAVERGARPATQVDYQLVNQEPVPAIFGIGDSLIYFIDESMDLGFLTLQDITPVPDRGFYRIDHLTNNVFKGTMSLWADFYKNIFGFSEVRYFDIKGQKTGLTSFALRSPCGQFCIPINEADQAKSQINEYLEQYGGPGIQHLAFLTEDLVASLQALKGTSIKTLDIDPKYYQEVFQKVDGVTEDKKLIEELNVLVDGDEQGYLLQIFTKNLIGPIFIEMIQRKNHLSFGEGNFQALFDSIERDQMKRGYL